MYEISKLKTTDIESMNENCASNFYHQTKADLNSYEQFNLFFLDDAPTILGPLKGPLNCMGSVHSSFSNFSNADITFKNDYFSINGEHYRLFRILEFPKAISPCFLQNLGDFALKCKKLKIKDAKTKLELGRRTSYSSMQSSFTSFDNEAAFSQNEQLLKDVTSADESLWRVNAWMIEKADTLENLNTKTKQLSKNLYKADLKFLIETAGLSNACESLYKQRAPFTPNTHTLHSSFLANLLPLHEDSLHKNGIKFNSRSGRAVYFDLFDPKALNSNALITGPSGSGKSFLVAKIIKEHFEQGTKVLILDRGASFEKLTNYLGAHQIKQSFNPFEFNDPVYIKELIISLIPKNERTKLFEGKLLNLLNNAPKITNLKTLLELLDPDMPEIKHYLAELTPFIDDNILKDNQLTYIDLENFPTAILPALVIYLMKYFESLEGKKLMIMDECHYLLRNNPAFVEQNFREIRKKGGSICALTQNFDDFLVTPLGQSIAKCSFFKIFFNSAVKPSEFLSTYDTENIESLAGIKGEYSECYITSEFDQKIIRYYPSPTEYELFQTNAGEDKGLLKYLKDNIDYLGFKRSLDNFVALKYLTAFCFCLLSLNTKAAVTGDLALFEIVANTAAQLNELEELVTSSQKHTAALRRMSEITEDKIYSAQRIEMWAADMNAMSTDGKGLEGLNDRIRSLKMKREDISSIIADLYISEAAADKDITSTQNIKAASKSNLIKYQSYALKSPSTTSEANAMITRNTASSVVEQSKTNTLLASQNKDILQIKKHLLATERRRLQDKKQRDLLYGVISEKL